MRIMLTNDDGIDAPGLHALLSVLERHGDVTVIAPDRRPIGHQPQPFVFTSAVGQ